MLMLLLGVFITILLYSAWELIEEYELNKKGFIMVVITVCGLFGVISFIGNAYAEGEPGGAFRAGAAGLFLVLILGILTYRVLTAKKLKTVSSNQLENAQ